MVPPALCTTTPTPIHIISFTSLKSLLRMCSNLQALLSRSSASSTLQNPELNLLGRQRSRRPCEAKNFEDTKDQKGRSRLKRSRASTIESFNMTNLAEATEKLQDDSGSFPSMECPDLSSFPTIEWPDDVQGDIGDDSIRSNGSSWSSSSSNSSFTDATSPSKSKRRRGLVRSRHSFDLCSMEEQGESAGLFW